MRTSALTALWWTTLFLCLFWSYSTQLFSARHLPLFGFGLIPPISAGVILLLVLVRWDYKPRLPDSYLAWLLLFSAGAGLLVATFLNIYWLPSIALPAGIFAFLLSHNARQKETSEEKSKRVSLVNCGWPAIALVMPANTLLLFFFQEYTELLAKSTGFALRFFGLPHVTYPSLISFASSDYFYSDSTNAWYSFPLFFAILTTYSAIFKRSALETVANLLIAFLLMGIFHIGIVSIACFATENYEGVYWSGDNWNIILGGCGAFLFLVFVSLERLGRGVMAPIGASFLPEQANPLVIAWNSFAQGSANRKNASVSGSPNIATGLAIISLAGFIAAVVPKALQNADGTPIQRSATDLVALLDQAQIDGYKSSYTMQPIANCEGAVAIVTDKQSLSLTEFSLSSRTLTNDTELFQSARGWRQALRRAAQRAADSESTELQDTLFLTAKISSDSVTTRDDSNRQQDLTFQMIKHFAYTPTEAELSQARQEFDRKVDLIESAADSSQASQAVASRPNVLSR